VDDDVDWITVTPSSGSENGIITVNCTENPDTIQRVGTITITGEGITRTVIVTQASLPSLIVAPSDQLEEYTAGSTTFTITSNRSWTVEDDADWITIRPSSGSNDGTFTATYAENPDTIQRIGIIRVIGGGLTRILSIKQKAKTFLYISPLDTILSADSNVFNLIIYSNTDWQLNQETDWLNLSKYAGSTSDTVHVYCETNEQVKSREGTIKIFNEEISRELIVRQSAAKAFLNIIPNNKVVTTDSGRISIKIESNTAWSVQESISWMDLLPDSGDGSIIVCYMAANDSLSRIGTLIFTADTLSKQFVLTQEGLAVYEINALVDSSESGTTSGSGRYLFNSRAAVIAYPRQGWLFENWKENSSVVSTDSIYNFIVFSPRILIAKFQKILTEVKDENKLPDYFEVFQNYPNPFNPSTIIKFALPINSKVNLILYNSLGQEVATLLNTDLDAGIHETVYNASDLSSGVYFYMLKVQGANGSNFTSTKRMVLMK
jgi:hypothetical protein